MSNRASHISAIKNVARIAAENSRYTRFTWGTRTFGSLEQLLADEVKVNNYEVTNQEVRWIAYDALSEVGIIRN